MGDAADMAIEAMERGSYLVTDLRTGRSLWVDGCVLMYSNEYMDSKRYRIESESELEEDDLLSALPEGEEK